MNTKERGFFAVICALIVSCVCFANSLLAGPHKLLYLAEPGIRDWHTQMSAHDAELVEALTGGLLADLDYQRAYPKISRPVKAEAKRYRKWWTRKLAARHQAYRARGALQP